MFSHDSRWLALRAPSNVVEIWDLPDHRLVKRLPDAGVPAYFGEGDAELVTVKESHLLGWDLKTWKPTHTVQLEFTPAMLNWGPLGDRLLAAAGGELFAVGDTNGIIHVLNRKSRREVSFVKVGAVALALSPNDRWLALIEDTEQRTVQLWELRDGKARREVSRRAHARELTHLIFSPDSRRLATFAGDSLAKLWLVEPFELLHELRGHKRGLFGGGFSPDGHTLASVDHVHDVNLWHVETGRQLASFVPAAPAGGSKDLVEAAFSPDGQYLVVSWRDGSCQFWHAPPFQNEAASVKK